MAIEKVVGAGGGGGGCFRKGTLIQLENGLTKSIEEVQVGDTVLSFNELGCVELDIVEQVHFHEEPEPLLRVKFWRGYVDITSNHWVLNQYGSFVEVGSLTTHDAFIDGMGHLRPIILAEPLPPEPVYNLTVRKNHTFIANSIRVHNGGYRQRYPIIGSGGGGGGSSKGGGGRAAVEDPDSLRSVQYASVIDAISEGEIEGFVNPSKPYTCIYLDDTPVEAPDGTRNFTGFDAILNKGRPDQEYIPGFADVKAESSVNVEVQHDIPVTRTVTNQNADAVVVTLGFPRLSRQDPSTGDLHGTSVDYKIEINTNGGGYQPVLLGSSLFPLTLGNPEDGPTFLATSSSTYNFVKGTIKWDGDTNTAPESATVAVQYSPKGTNTWTTLGSFNLAGSPHYVDIKLFTWLRVLAPGTSTRDFEFYLPSQTLWDTRVIKVSGTGTVQFTSISGGVPTSTITVSGKSTSRFQKAHRIEVVGTGPWDIRVTRITADSTTSNVADKIYWDSFTEIIDTKLAYPNTALVAVSVDSEQFQAIPKRGYLIKGLKVRIPSNYNPLTRAYTGIWDGTFNVAWTDNPAWCFYDLITNERYGLGTYIDPTQVDIWSLYTIAQYCDELVPDGYGGLEPRFTCNLYIQSRQEAYKVINDMASIFRGIVFWASGTVVPLQDCPTDPIAIFNRANVIDGTFVYQGSSAKKRHTVALVTYNDPMDNYKAKIEYVEDTEAIAKFGIIETEVTAMGCTSRGQAHRLGKSILFTEKLETEIVNFKTGLDGLMVRPGDVILVNDPIKSGERRGGRILESISTTQLKLDSALNFTSNGNFVIYCVMPSDIDANGEKRPSGVLESRNIVTVGNTDIVTISPPLPQLPQVGSMWVISSDDLVATPWRVVSVKEGDEGSTAEISALRHYSGKYDLIDFNVSFETLPTSTSSISVNRPASGHTEDSIYFNGANIVTKISVSWEQTLNAVRYFVKYKRDNGNWVDMKESMSPSIDIENVADGSIYTIRVYSISPIGTRSPTYLELIHTVVGKTAPPSDVSNFQATLQPGGVLFTWDDIPDIDRFDFAVWESTVDIDSAIWTATNYLQKPPMTSGIHTFHIRSRDTTGNLSTNTSTSTFTVQNPSQPVLSLEYKDTNIVLSWQDCTTTHYLDKYIVKVDTNNQGWDNIPTFSEVKGTGVVIPVTWTGTAAQILVKAVDIAGNTNTVASYINVTPTMPSLGLSNAISSDSIIISWTPTTGSLPIVNYEIRYGPSWALSTYVTKVSSHSYSYIVNYGGSRTWWVAAIDSAGNYSTPSSTVSTILLPSTPIIGYTFVGTSTVLSWPSSKTTLPIDYYEIRRGSDWSSGVVLGKSYITSFTTQVDWTTNAQFLIKAYDSAGNISTEGTVSVNIDAPITPQIGYSFIGSECVLTWTDTTQSSLPISGYEVRYGATWNTGTLVGKTTDGMVSTPASWTGSRTFFLSAYDSAGTYGSVTSVNVSTSTYLAPSNLSAVQNITDIVLSWNPATSGTSSIDYYEVLYGNILDSATLVGKSKTTTITIPISWLGTRTFWVRAVDVYGKQGSASSVAFNVTAPGSLSINSSIIGVKAQLSWSVPSSTLPIDRYEIRYGTSWASGTPITSLSGTSYRINIDWSGTRTFWVTAFDVNNNASTSYSSVVSVGIPDAPSVSSTVLADSFVLSWNTPSSSLPITNYEIRYGNSWNAGTLVGQSNTNTYSIPGAWIDSRIFWVSAIDINGTYGTAASVSCNITAPLAPTNYRGEVVDNNVLLYWNEIQGTMPTLTYELRKGTTWATADSIGRKAGGFTTIFETSAGTFKYWIAAVDTANNIGTPTSVTVVVNQPPDYVLKAEYDSAFAGTKTNMLLDNGYLTLPINNVESYQQHFTSHAWTTPQNQVDASYPVYVQPNLRPATYSETFDYGTILAANKVTLFVNQQDKVGTVSMTSSISTSPDGSTWTVYSNVSQTFATNFRYVKIDLTWTAANDTSLAEVYQITVRLDSKLKTSTATVNCIAPVSGTYSQAGTLLTVTASGTWNVGQVVDLGFTSGTATTNIYTIAVGGSGTFGIYPGTNTTTSGGVNIDTNGTVLFLTDDRTATGNKLFIDVDAIQVTPGGTTPCMGLYNFVDVPNPLYTKILLFNTAGSRVSGTASTTVRGF